MSSKSCRKRHQLKETVGEVAEADGCWVRPVGVAQREEFRQPGESLAGDPALDGPVRAYLSRSETWGRPANLGDLRDPLEVALHGRPNPPPNVRRRKQRPAVPETKKWTGSSQAPFA